MSPIKPTRDDAAHAPDVEEMDGEEERHEEHSEIRRVYGTERHPRGSDQEGDRREPHVSKSAKNAPVQRTSTSPTPVEPLPANASGRDRVSTDAMPRVVDEESAYDLRPSQDKDRPPSERDG